MQFSILRTIAVSAVTISAPVTAQQIPLPDGGSITGTLKTSTAGTKIQVFRGIPYAEPPIGERRWKVSTVKPLAGDINATGYGNVCFSDGQANNSEDCLFLNVFTPAGVTSMSNLPVMVWIHGGSFTAGSGNLYDGTNLVGASGNKIVYVSINYRLSVFGFLAGDALKAEGNGVNFGIRDAATAFEWVKQNIVHFGGNPKDVTAFGESAGAKSVTALLLSGDGNQQFFQKAIAESGSYTSAHNMPNSTVQNAAFDQIATQVGCSSANDLASRLKCLRSANSNSSWSVGGSLSPWQPVVDRVFLLDSPIRRVLDGKMGPVPTIFGSNTNEGFSFVPAITSDDALDSYLKNEFPLLNDDDVEQIVKLYPAASFPSPRHRAAEIYGDYNYVCPSELASLVQAQDGRKTFRYRFNETSSQEFGIPLVLHTAELEYVFGNASAFPEGASASSLIEDFQRYWTNFALSGSPNGISTDGWNPIKGFVHWPQYNGTTREQIMLQSREIVLEQTGTYMPLHTERCLFWYEVEQRLAPELSE